MKKYNYLLIFLMVILTSFFCVEIVKAENVETYSCVYRAGNVRGNISRMPSLIGVNPNGHVFEFDESGASRTHLGTVRTANFQGFSEKAAANNNCATVYYYSADIGGARGDGSNNVFSTNYCGELHVMAVQEFAQKCDFLLDHVTLIPQSGIRKLDRVTLRKGIEDHGDNLLFTIDSVEYNYGTVTYDPLSIDEINDEAEKKAREERNKHMDSYIQCVKDNNINRYNACAGTQDESITAFMNCVGDVPECASEKEALINAENNLDNLMRNRLIQISMGQVSCRQLLGDELLEFFKTVWLWIQITGASLVIILSMLDFTKVVASGSEADDFKKIQKRFTKRLLILALLILLPILIEFFLGQVGIADTSPFCE